MIINKCQLIVTTSSYHNVIIKDRDFIQTYEWEKKLISKSIFQKYDNLNNQKNINNHILFTRSRQTKGKTHKQTNKKKTKKGKKKTLY